MLRQLQCGKKYHDGYPSQCRALAETFSAIQELQVRNHLHSRTQKRGPSVRGAILHRN